MEEKSGKPSVEEWEGETQNQSIVEGIVNPGLDGGAEDPAQAQRWSEPLGEGADVRPEEGVDGVGKAVVRAEPTVGYMHQGLARPERVNHVGARARHVWVWRWALCFATVNGSWWR